MAVGFQTPCLHDTSHFEFFLFSFEPWPTRFSPTCCSSCLPGSKFGAPVHISGRKSESALFTHCEQDHHQRTSALEPRKVTPVEDTQAKSGFNSLGHLKLTWK